MNTSITGRCHLFCNKETHNKNDDDVVQDLAAGTHRGSTSLRVCIRPCLSHLLTNYGPHNYKENINRRYMNISYD